MTRAPLIQLREGFKSRSRCLDHSWMPRFLLVLVLAIVLATGETQVAIQRRMGRCSLPVPSMKSPRLRRRLSGGRLRDGCLISVRSVVRVHPGPLNLRESRVGFPLLASRCSMSGTGSPAVLEGLFVYQVFLGSSQRLRGSETPTHGSTFPAAHGLAFSAGPRARVLWASADTPAERLANWRSAAPQRR